MSLTPEQVENWRKVLRVHPQIGPAALLLSAEQINEIAKQFNFELRMLNHSIKQTVEDKQRRLSGICEHNIAAKHCKMCKKKMEREEYERKLS